MSAKTLNIDHLLIRNDSKKQWETINPVLSKGELGIEIDGSGKHHKIKVGDGSLEWKKLPYLSGTQAKVATIPPTTTDKDYDLGTLWVDSQSKAAYVLVNVTGSIATWNKMVTPTDLEEFGAGDMLKSVYDTNGNGIVDRAEKADAWTTAGTFSATSPNKTLSVKVTSSGIQAGKTVSVTADLPEINSGTGPLIDTVDKYGRVTGRRNIATSDLPSKSTGTFTKVTVENGLITSGETQITYADISTTAKNQTDAAENDVVLLNNLKKVDKTLLPKVTSDDISTTATSSADAAAKDVVLLGVDKLIDKTLLPKVTSGDISGALTPEQIPALDADKITSGTLHVDRIPELSADKITSGILNVERIPELDSSKITGLGTAAKVDTGTTQGTVPILGTGGKLDTAVIPSLAISDVIEVNSQEAMLAATAQQGDIAVRSDINKTFILKASPATELSNWVELKTPSDLVKSVNGKTGVVSLNTDNIDEGSTNHYWTDTRFDNRFKTKNSTELADTANIAYTTDTFTLNCGDASTGQK